MAIQKKSLIGTLSATKKAIVATNVASTAPTSGTKLETAKKGGGHYVAKAHAAHSVAKGVPHHVAKGGGHHVAKGTMHSVAKSIY